MDLLERAMPGGPDERENQGTFQGSGDGRRGSGERIYTSEQLQVHSGEGRGATPALLAYATDGPGADDEAISEFRKSGVLDFRARQPGQVGP